MAIERKCPACLTWNGSETHCKNCGVLLDPNLIRDEAIKLNEVQQAEKEPNILDRIYTKMRYSRWLVVRAIFWVVYSVWFVFFSIISFFLALVAAGPG